MRNARWSAPTIDLDILIADLSLLVHVIEDEEPEGIDVPEVPGEMEPEERAVLHQGHRDLRALLVGVIVVREIEVDDRLFGLEHLADLLQALLVLAERVEA